MIQKLNILSEDLKILTWKELVLIQNNLSLSLISSFFQDEFIRMNYRNGDNYGNACNKTARNAVIYIQCANQVIKLNEK